MTTPSTQHETSATAIAAMILMFVPSCFREWVASTLTVTNASLYSSGVAFRFVVLPAFPIREWVNRASIRICGR